MKGGRNLVLSPQSILKVPRRHQQSIPSATGIESIESIEEHENNQIDSECSSSEIISNI